MPPTTQKISAAQFAASIKQKYPAYAGVDDNTLVQKMLAKYPVYQDKVDTTPSTGGPTPLPSPTTDTRNIFQKALGFVADPLVTMGVRAGQAAGELIGTAGEKMGLLRRKTMADTTSAKVPFFGTNVKPISKETPGTVAGQALGTVGLGVGSPLLGGAMLGAAGGLESKQGAGMVTVDAAIGALGGKIMEVGVAKATPYITKFVAKYGQEALVRLQAQLPDYAKPLLDKFIQKTAAIAPKVAEKDMSQQAYEQALNITRPKYTPTQTKEAFTQGRFKTPGKISESYQEKRVAEAVQPLIEDGRIDPKKMNPVQIRDVMAEEVQRTNQSVKAMITDRNQPVFQSEITSRLASGKTNRIFPDKPSEQLYDKVIAKIKDLIKDKNTLGLFDARQEFDSYIRKTMGEKVFEKSDSASLAIQDARNAVNEFIADLLPKNNPYRAQLLRESNLLTGIQQMSTNAPEIFKEANKTFFQKHPYLKDILRIALPASVVTGLGIKGLEHIGGPVSP